MKYLFLAAILISSFTVSTAQLKVAGQNPAAKAPAAPVAISAADIGERQTKYFDGVTQAASWRAVDTTDAQYFFHYSQSTPASTVIEYDGPSNSLSLVRSLATFAPDNTVTTKVGVMRSNNMGQSWTFDVLQDIPGFLGMPNMAQIREGTNPLNWPVFIYGVGYALDRSPLGYFKSIYRVDGQTTELSFSNPPSGRPNYIWSAADLAVDKENRSIMGISQLDYVRNIGVQFGEYGFFNFSLASEDFFPEGTVEAFSTSVFRQGNPPNPDGSLGTSPLLDVDADGRIYAAFNNLMPVGEARTVVVATSEDQGSTWSPLNIMPTGLISALETSLGLDVIIQPGLTPYQGSAFIVTSPNEYSYFFRVAAGPFTPGDTTRFNITNHIILEARYSGGVWSLDTVANLALGLSVEGVSVEYPEYSIDEVRTAQRGTPHIVVDAAGRSIELEVAKTGDGNLLVKYLDEVPGKIIEINPPVALMVISDQGDTIDASAALDTLIWTDIFVTSRPLSGGTWKTPVNVSNDMAFNKSTYMPREVPSLQQIPLIQIQSVGSTNAMFANMPPTLIGALSNRPGVVQFAVVNDVTDVADERTFDFNVNSVAPNPSNNTAELTFTLDNGATVTAELFDVLGNKIRTVIAPSFISAGLHGVSVDVNTLTAGQYYVTVNVDGKRVTRSLVVVK